MKDTLKQLAETLRQEATNLQTQKNAKCAQIVKAAAGLSLLKEKLGGHKNVG